MTALQTDAFHAIEKLVSRLSPQPVCDDCISQTLGLSSFDHAEQATHELAGANGFQRSKDVCSLCGETRSVIARR
ncbi:hypothetical protein WBP07_21190 (plasmid) [Novosphingobium sp. BL-8A]|uniref:hypothetical protein n=1 Tax=Novosphingobium sp. BL-8A TaxID=3127639 RepID=UPI0037564383